MTIAVLAAAVLPACGTTATTTTSSTTTTTTTTTATTSTSTTTTAPASGDDALAVLAAIPVAKEHPAGYDRDLFPHWIRVGDAGCDVRDEVLIRSSHPAAQVDPYGCGVREGDWVSSYDAVTVTDPGALDIDHVVALKEAWDSGAWAWTPGRRTAFANDLTDERTLRAVTASSNRSKGDRDPSNWLPPNAADTCRYLGAWIAVKARWGLSADQSEWRRIRNVVRGRCPGLRIAPWTDPPA